MINLTKFIVQWQEKILRTQGITRECFESIYSELKAKPIKIITGFRRSGKSFLTAQIIQQAIIDTHYVKNNILYINFEDIDLLTHRDLSSLQDIWNIFHNEISSPGPKLVVFDEIQLVPHWQNFIRNLYEKEKEVSIFITGSNSDMLSSELSSVLAGRCIEFFILPFSFQEVLSLKNIFIHDNADYFRQEKEILECFQEFFLYGGLPEVYSITTESARYSYLEGIVKKVILDDVIHRFQIKNTILLEELFSYVLNGVGNILFVNKLTKQINQIKKTKYLPSTLSDYLRYLEQAFSIFSVSKFDWKQSKIFDNTKKYYCIDLGIVNAFSQKNQSLESRKLENLVFLHLLKNKQKIFFGQDNTHKEIDFIVPRFHKYDKFQVCFSLSAENQLRELGNFALAEKYLSSSAQYLIVKNWDKNIILPPNIILREITRFLLDLEDT